MHTDVRRLRKVARGLVVFAAAAALGCSAGERDTEPSSGPGGAESAGARALVEGLRARFQASSGEVPRVVTPSIAECIDRDGSRLRPRMRDAALRGAAPPATVTLPARADGAFALTDVDTGMTIEVALAGATSAPGEMAEGLVIYRGGHTEGADIIHRPSPQGTEDALFFERAPSAPELRYEVTLGDGVAGVRLVARTVELLDAAGAPRLRMAPPFVVDARGERHEASVSVSGCDHDTSPRAPWGRPVTSPGAAGCTVQVGWGGAELIYPVLVDPGWTTTGDMMVGRHNHTASVLLDGRILVAGGQYGPLGSIVFLASAEIYDPDTGTWSAASAMNGPHTSHTSNRLFDGTILISGGALDSTANLATAERYDPAQGTWTESLMPSVHAYHAAVVLMDGQVLVAGGVNGNNTGKQSSADLYDPATGAWSSTGSMADARSDHTLSVLHSGQVLAVGGKGNGTTLLTTELYDPDTKAWSSAGPMNEMRNAHTASVLPDGRVLVAGGQQPGSVFLNKVELYTPGAGWSQAPNMNDKRKRHTATVLSNGAVLVAGGEDSFFHVSVDLYDPTQDIWIPQDGMSVARSSHTATLLSTCEVLVAAGHGAPPDDLVSAERFSFEVAGGPCGSAKPYCADGACCDTPCTETCKSCGTGTCSLLPLGAIDLDAAAPCAGPNACDGNGNCKKIDGRTCAADAECVHGHCVDGVCCDASCAGTCVACDLPSHVGACTSIPLGLTDPACNGINVCDGAGACKVADGQPCSTGDDCGGGQCFDGVCCSSSCAATCMSCALPGHAGTCWPVPAAQADADAASPCAAPENTCDGSGLCKKTDGQSCGGGGDCLNGNCVEGVCCDTACDGACDVCFTGKCAVADPSYPGNPSCLPAVCNGIDTSCPTTCASDAGCAGGYYCAADTTCQQKKAKGDPCSVVAGFDCFESGCAVCATGFCADHVCCDAACDGPCDVCEISLGATEDGQCEILAAGSSGSPSCDPHVCDGFGPSCPTSCAGDDECAPSSYCALPDGVCQPDRDEGEPCASGSQCNSGFCADGVCCDQKCGEGCKACLAALKVSGPDGECGDVLADTDPHDACEEEGAESCKLNGMCDGTGSCAYYVKDTLCEPGQCVGNSAKSWTCNGQGICGEQPIEPCTPFVCDAATGACKTECEDDPDCATGFVCADESCKPSGMTCDGDHTLKGADGSSRDCSPFECTGDVCLDRCATFDDCVEPHVCDEHGKCVEPCESSSLCTPEDAGCACSAPGSTRAPNAAWRAAAVLLLLLRRLSARGRGRRASRNQSS